MALTQSHYRFGIDELAESTHGWHAAEDKNPVAGVIAVNTPFLLRFTIQANATGLTNIDAEFQVRKNGGAYQAITTTSSIVKAVAVAAFANGDNTTQRLSGTGTFEASSAGCTEDGISGGAAFDIVASGNGETECGLQIVGTDVTSWDVLEFRLTRDGGTLLDTYSVIPTLIVNTGTAPVVQDTFCDATGTTCSAHTGDTGATWTNEVQSVAQDAVVTDEDRLRCLNGDGGSIYCQASGIPSSSNYEIRATFYCKTVRTSQFSGVVGRYTTGPTYLIRLFYVGSGTPRWLLEKIVAGVTSELGSYNQTLSAATAYAVVLRMVGSAISVTIDGVERITVTDGDVTAAGRVLVTFFDDNAGTPPADSTGVHLDNVLVVMVQGGSARTRMRTLMGVGG